MNELNEQVRQPEVAVDELEARPFFGQENFEGAQYTLGKEESHHRVICYLAAQGYTTTEISEQTGFTKACVAYVRKQPWALELIAKLIAKFGGTGVKQVLQGAALEAAKTIVAVMDGTIESRPEVRAKCANDILDRLYGTAPKILVHQNVEPSELSDEELASAIVQNTNN